MTRWIPVLVRLEDYAEITSLVAKREASRRQEVSEVVELDSALATPPASAITDPHADLLAAMTPWEVDDLRQLAHGTSQTAQRWTRAMDVCCAVADTDNPWLGTSEVAARSGMKINEWRDAPRKMTRHLKANYPNIPVDARGDQVWPLLAKSKAGSHELHWAMNAEQARRWRTARGIG